MLSNVFRKSGPERELGTKGDGRVTPFFFNMKRSDLGAEENSDKQRTQEKMVMEGELITGLRIWPQQVVSHLLVYPFQPSVPTVAW